jgi:hypothetical protein
MSAIVQRVKEVLSPEERLRRQAKQALDIADKIIIEMQAQQINIKKCVEYQESMLDKLHRVMDGAKKLGDKPLYKQSGKFAEVVGDWHAVTKQMMSDESTMIQFIAMVKTFYIALIEYKQIVKSFAKTTKDFVSLKKFGLAIPKQIEDSSAEAAGAFRELVNSLTAIRMHYTGLADYTLEDDEDKWSKCFDEERQQLMQKQQGSENSK